MSRIRLTFSLAVLFGGAIFLAMLFSIPAPRTVSAASAASTSYLGFDRNVYPGDAGMLIMRKTFAYTSYWLSPPPGEKTNTWRGKRELLRAQGFGFLVVYRGRDSGEFKKAADGPVKGVSDAAAAIASAR